MTGYFGNIAQFSVGFFSVSFLFFLLKNHTHLYVRFFYLCFSFVSMYSVLQRKINETEIKYLSLSVFLCHFVEKYFYIFYFPSLKIIHSLIFGIIFSMTYGADFGLYTDSTCDESRASNTIDTVLLDKCIRVISTNTEGIILLNQHQRC